MQTDPDQPAFPPSDIEILNALTELRRAIWAAEERGNYLNAEIYTHQAAAALGRYRKLKEQGT